MKKIYLFIFVIIGFALAFSACNKSETYADRLKKEKRAINRFIINHNIDVLNTFPEDSNFKKDQYFRDANTGVYFRIENWGEGETIDQGTDVYLRVAPNSILLVDNDTIKHGNSQPTTAMVFTYGIESTYSSLASYMSSNWPWTKDDYEYVFLSPACILPLKHGLRNGGIVSFIIPFSSGSKYQKSSNKPLYIPEMRYTFYND